MSSKNKVDSAERTSSGVAELIERLRSDGVKSGKEEAARIVAEAERQAEGILEQARAKAESLVAEARRETESLRNAGEEALRLAGRNAAIEMRETLRRRLEERTRRLVSEQLEDREMIQRLILEVVGRAMGTARLDESGTVELLLPLEILGMEELRERPEELQGKLSHLVKQIASATLREGVDFRALGPGERGIKVRLTGEGIQIDMTDQAIADNLLRHLQPRFRALMEGMIR